MNPYRYNLFKYALGFDSRKPSSAIDICLQFNNHPNKGVNGFKSICEKVGRAPESVYPENAIGDVTI